MGLQVIVALEPRAFREVVAGALRLLRPAVVVHPVDGSRVRDVLDTVEVDLVIANEAHAVRPSRSTWLVCSDPTTATLVAGSQATGISSFDFSTLLSIVDGMTTRTLTA